MEDGGFTLVKRRGNASKQQKAPSPAQSPGFSYKAMSSKSKAAALVPTFESVVMAIESAVLHMRTSAFYEHATASIRTCEKPVIKGIDCVCYGIGSISESRISQHQLAFLILLHEEHQFANVECFDPVFSELDGEVLKSFGMTQIVNNERAKRSISQETLFFMPHCGHTMYSNVLASNWTPAQVDKLAIIGNMFSAYPFVPRQMLMRQQSPYLMKMLPHVSEICLSDVVYAAGDVFNNTSYHWFSNVSPNNVEEFWRTEDIKSIPDEEDLELL
ncbi:hypothetical protein HDU77_000583 [Chytriomyces hyalinus]|nr:hypothetical protein HDU77_000583 [Chytriomyces hyalinus]